MPCSRVYRAKSRDPFLSVSIRVHPWPNNSVETFLDHRWLHDPRHPADSLFRHHTLAAFITHDTNFNRRIEEERVNRRSIPPRQPDVRPTLPAGQVRRVHVRHRTPYRQALPDQIADSREHARM